MNQDLMVFLISTLVALVVFVVIPMLLAKFGKTNLDSYIKNSKFVLGFIETIVKKIKLPNGKEKLISLVVHYAKVAVDYVEDLYKAGQLNKEDRKQKAVEFVEKALVENGFAISNKEKSFIENTIEVMVFMLPPTHVK